MRSELDLNQWHEMPLFGQKNSFLNQTLIGQKNMIFKITSIGIPQLNTGVLLHSQYVTILRYYYLQPIISNRNFWLPLFCGLAPVVLGLGSFHVFTQNNKLIKLCFSVVKITERPPMLFQDITKYEFEFYFLLFIYKLHKCGPFVYGHFKFLLKF